MKRKSIIRGGGEDENGDGGTTKKHSSSSSNNKKKKTKTNSSPSPPVIGTVATRTRRQTKANASSWNQPISILINIMSYADPETIRLLCCVSKQFYDLITKNPGLEHNRVVPLLQISPAKDQEDDKGRIGRLLRFLQHHSDKLQRYREIKIIDVQQFVSCLSPSDWLEMQKITDTLRLYGIVSLDLSFPTPSTDMGGNGLCILLSSILPNLRDVNLSNNGFGYSYLFYFSIKCPNLEKLTWHNINREKSSIIMDGWALRRATNLKEIYMDGSVFDVVPDKRDLLSDLENDEHSNISLFHKCSSKILERVSIRNSKWDVRGDLTVIPQNALIKFVRNAPTSLRWFRSDLTKDNMTILRSERPDIELVN